MTHACLGLCFTLLVTSLAFAQDDEGELPSGLLAEYSTKGHSPRTAGARGPEKTRRRKPPCN